VLNISQDRTKVIKKQSKRRKNDDAMTKFHNNYKGAGLAANLRGAAID
jgi:peptide deformylase